MSITLCRRLALVFGIVLPVLETWRRWNTGSSFWSWFDDVLIGAFLLYAAWRSRADSVVGTRYLAAAFAFAIGIGYNSITAKLAHIGATDVSGFSTVAVLLFIGPLWLLALWAMIACLRADPPTKV
jgi:hypothetical protein